MPLELKDHTDPGGWQTAYNDEQAGKAGVQEEEETGEKKKKKEKLQDTKAREPERLPGFLTTSQFLTLGLILNFMSLF